MGHRHGRQLRHAEIDPWAEPDDPEARTATPKPLPRTKSVRRDGPYLGQDWVEKLLIRVTGRGWDED